MTAGRAEPGRSILGPIRPRLRGASRGCSRSSRSRSSSGSVSLGTGAAGHDPGESAVSARPTRPPRDLPRPDRARPPRPDPVRAPDRPGAPAGRRRCSAGSACCSWSGCRRTWWSGFGPWTLGLGDIQLVWLILSCQPRHRAGGHRPQRPLAAPLQVHLGGGRGRRCCATYFFGDEINGAAPEPQPRPDQRPAGRAPQGDPRRVPGRLPVGVPAAPRRGIDEGRPDLAAAAAVPRPDGRDVGDRPRPRRRPARPRRGAPVLHRLPVPAVRRDRPGRLRRRRRRPVPRRLVRDVPPRSDRPDPGRHLARPVQGPDRRRLPDRPVAVRLRPRRAARDRARGGPADGRRPPADPGRSTPTSRWPRSARSSAWSG